jgi:hypothetical protein
MRAERLRALNLPRHVVVELDAAAQPISVDGRSVEALGEVWRVDDEWWRAPIQRRFVEAILEGGRHVVLFEDLVTAEWFVQTP